MRGLSTTAGFLLIPVLSAVAPLLVIPAIAHEHGADGWAAIAIAIAIGNASAIVIDLGYGVVGPQQVAKTPGSAAAQYGRSLAARASAAAVVLPLAALAAALLAPSETAGAVLATVGIGAAGLGPAWYLTGLGRPWRILLVETLPKCVASVVATIALWAGGPLVGYGAALCVAVLVTVTLTTVLGRGTAPLPRRAEFRAVPGLLREQAVLITGRAVSTVSTVLPTVLLGLVAPSLVASFAALDRPVRMGLQVLQAAPARLQGWLGSAGAEAIGRRIRIVVLANLTLGLVAAAVVTIAAPVVLPVLFSDVVDLRFDAVLAAAALVLAVCTSRGLGMAVVARGRAGATSSAAVVIALVGIVGTVVGASTAGIAGALVGLFVAEVAGLVPQAFALTRADRRN